MSYITKYFSYYCIIILSCNGEDFVTQNSSTDIYSLALYIHANVLVVVSEDFVWDMNVIPQIIQVKSH